MHPIHQQTLRGSTQPIPRPIINSDLKTNYQKKRLHQHKNPFTEVVATRRERSESVCEQMLEGRVLFIVRERG